MFNELKEVLTQQTGTCAENSIENALAGLILQLSENNSDTTEIILADLRLEEMNITALVKHITEYARKNKQNGGYYMSNTKAIELVKDFYKLPGTDNIVSFPISQKPKLALSLEFEDVF